jgi:hypothetical protein
MSSEHFSALSAAYAKVGSGTWQADDFLHSNLEASRELFMAESLAAGRPRPKALEVLALLSGLPFRVDFLRALVEVQQRLADVIGDRLHYWVTPENFGVEYCVFKWPTDPWNEQNLEVIRRRLASVTDPMFRFHIGGVQINPDGCVVARGYDEEAALFRIRRQLKSDLPFLPSRQSGWAHVPLGRILEPVGSQRFAKLADVIRGMSDAPIATTEIDSMKLIHETRWYMEEKTVLAEYPLGHAEVRSTLR